MRWLWRVLLVLVVFGVVGYAAMRMLIAHAVARGLPEYSVRLGGAMGGLFLGGGAAVVVMIALLVGGKRKAPEREEG